MDSPEDKLLAKRIYLQTEICWKVKRWALKKHWSTLFRPIRQKFIFTKMMERLKSGERNYPNIQAHQWNSRCYRLYIGLAWLLRLAYWSLLTTLQQNDRCNLAVWKICLAPPIQFFFFFLTENVLVKLQIKAHFLSCVLDPDTVSANKCWCFDVMCYISHLLFP